MKGKPNTSKAGLVLVLNGGSSSIKFGVFEQRESIRRVLEGKIERIGLPGTVFVVDNLRHEIGTCDHESAGVFLLDWLSGNIRFEEVRAIGHRVVHGGKDYSVPQLITSKLLSELRSLSSLDPEHLPAEISLIQVFLERQPNLPQVACFDTAFHRNIARVAQLLPLPRRYEATGLRRYGFHGLSYEFLMGELLRIGDKGAKNGRVILAHLGNGASMAAVRSGQCIDTSMGFTPASGLVMGSRAGDLDPGLPAYFARTEGMTSEQFDHMVNHEAGLIGVSETSSDMHELIGLEKNDPRAADAVALFCYQAKKWLGAFAAVLGGLDTLVFSGGIGENSAAIRARICDELGFLGIELEDANNAENAPRISSDASRVAVRVIRTNEELMIARSTCRIAGLER